MRWHGTLATAMVWIAGMAAGAQTPALEPVRGLPNALQLPAARATALSALAAAIQDLDLRRNGVPGFRLHASFEASGNLPYVGTGTLTEEWLGGGAWHWQATLGGVTLDRYPGVASSDPAAPMPLRVRMLRVALFRLDEVANAAVASIRMAKGKWQGASVTCYLFAPNTATLPGMFRAGSEQEYCFDAGTALPREWSPVAGVYYSYDYARAPVFQGHRLPRRVEVVQGGQVVLQARVDGITALDTLPAPPTALRRSSSMQNPMVRWVRWPLPPTSAATTAQQVLMHVAVNPAGAITESELVGAADPDLVKQVQGQLASLAQVGPISPDPYVGIQRELYVGVEFVPAAAPAPLPPVGPAPPNNISRPPYQGTQVSRTVRTLADGNVIETAHSWRSARDSQGRTYMESPLDIPMERTYTVNDPVAGLRFMVYPQRSFAIEHSMLGTPGGTVIGGVQLPPRSNTAAPPPFPRPARTTEPLGNETLDGFNATGTRTTEVYAAGSFGNRDPLTVVREIWRSADLGIVLKSVTNDPRNGITTTEFQDLQIGEPDASLFAIPAGYTVVDPSGKPIVR